MNEQDYIFLCRCLAKATSAAIRLYHEDTCRYYYSVYHLKPDPAAPFLPQLLDKKYSAGVITTPLYQFYGFLSLESGWRIIVGPTKIENNDSRLIEEQLFLIGVAAGQKEEYLKILRCAPMITAERMGWTISFLSTAVTQRPFHFEDLYVNVKPTEHRRSIQEKQALRLEDFWDDSDAQTLVQRSYEFEKLLLSYIEHGEPEKIRELLDALPDMRAGQMAEDTLRQLKDTAICAATLASRAAIAGGLDSQASFRLSDLYIQKTELLHDISSVEKLRNDLFIDFAELVQQIRYHTTLSAAHSGKDLFLACAHYVAKNIYNPIRSDEVAAALGYTRSYLCHQFKKQTGLTLTQYILQEKILEAQRMLEFTEKSLSEIAALFAFSSQSHFQTAFKRLSGETPMAYRQRKQTFRIPHTK